MKVNIAFLVGVAELARGNIAIARAHGFLGMDARERMESVADEVETLYQQLIQLADEKEIEAMLKALTSGQSPRVKMRKGHCSILEILSFAAA